MQSCNSWKSVLITVLVHRFSNTVNFTLQYFSFCNVIETKTIFYWFHNKRCWYHTHDIIWWDDFKFYTNKTLIWATSIYQGIGCISIIHKYFLTNTKRQITTSRQSTIMYCHKKKKHFYFLYLGQQLMLKIYKVFQNGLYSVCLGLNAKEFYLHFTKHKELFSSVDSVFTKYRLISVLEEFKLWHQKLSWNESQLSSFEFYGFIINPFLITSDNLVQKCLFSLSSKKRKTNA